MHTGNDGPLGGLWVELRRGEWVPVESTQLHPHTTKGPAIARVHTHMHLYTTRKDTCVMEDVLL